MMVLAVFILLVVLDASLTTSQSGPPWTGTDSVIGIFGAIVAGWACYIGFGKVFVTGSAIKSQNLWPRTARKRDILRIDIVPTHFGKRLDYVPVVVKKNGKSFQLRPLTWRTPVLANNPGWTLDRQREIVEELRSLVNTNGRDANLTS
jgi:hypothetical protein